MLFKTSKRLINGMGTSLCHITYLFSLDSQLFNDVNHPREVCEVWLWLAV